MRATEALQKYLGDSRNRMHAQRARTLLCVVEALACACRLILMDLARSRPGAERIRAPLQALSAVRQPPLRVECEHIYLSADEVLAGAQQSAHHPDRLVGSEGGSPVASAVRDDIGWRPHAANPGHGVRRRSAEFSEGRKSFLRQLAQLLPEHVRPILATDTGFRAPWFRAVEAMGWRWLGYSRHRTQVKQVEAADELSRRVTCKVMYELATRAPCAFDLE